MRNLKIITALALGAALTGAALAPQIASAHGNSQNVTVTIDGQGFHPASVNVKAGKEVHLTFVSKEASCANGFTIPALGRTISVAPGKKKEITFTPKEGQTIAFACTMNMFKGKVVAN